MDQSKNIVQRIGIVEQHIWMDAVNARGVGPGALPLILIDIDPALCVGFADYGKIFLSQRRQRLQ